jgi:hypothetical protein
MNVKILCDLSQTPTRVRAIDSSKVPCLLNYPLVCCGAHQLPTFNVPALKKLSKRDVSCSVTILAVFEFAAVINEESEATVRISGLLFVVVSIEAGRSELGSTAR